MDGGQPTILITQDKVIFLLEWVYNGCYVLKHVVPTHKYILISRKPRLNDDWVPLPTDVKRFFNELRIMHPGWEKCWDWVRERLNLHSFLKDTDVADNVSESDGYTDEDENTEEVDVGRENENESESESEGEVNDHDNADDNFDNYDHNDHINDNNNGNDVVDAIAEVDQIEGSHMVTTEETTGQQAGDSGSGGVAVEFEHVQVNETGSGDQIEGASMLTTEENTLPRNESDLGDEVAQVGHIAEAAEVDNTDQVQQIGAPPTTTPEERTRQRSECPESDDDNNDRIKRRRCSGEHATNEPSLDSIEHQDTGDCQHAMVALPDYFVKDDPTEKAWPFIVANDKGEEIIIRRPKLSHLWIGVRGDDEGKELLELLKDPGFVGSHIEGVDASSVVFSLEYEHAAFICYLKMFLEYAPNRQLTCWSEHQGE